METREKRGQTGLMMCKLFLVRTLVWPCLLPDQPKSGPSSSETLLLDDRASFLCARVCTEVHVVTPERRPWVRGPVYPWCWQVQQVRVCVAVCDR